MLVLWKIPPFAKPRLGNIQSWLPHQRCVFVPDSLRYYCLQNPLDGGAWWAAVHGVTKSQTRLSNFTFTFHFHVLEKEMATHSSVLAWRIPGTGEPGGLPSMGSHRVGHNWSDLAAASFTTLKGCSSDITSFTMLHPFSETFTDSHCPGN